MSIETSSINLARLYTADEFMRLSFEGDQQAELIEGRVIVPPPPGDEHGQVADNLRYHIFLADPDRKLGKIWMNSRFQITPDSAPAPDLAFVVMERVLPRSPGVVKLVPDLAVEVISPTDELKDIAKKVEIYRQGDIRELWLVWPRRQQVEVIRRGQTQPQLYGPNDELTCPEIIPGLKIPVKTLFE